jgi:hypothetical protein
MFQTRAPLFNWNLQPFIPIRLSDDWNLISRTNIPIVHQQSPVEGPEDECGLGDVAQSVLLAPQHGDVHWAVGPAFLFPTSSDPILGNKKWAAGPNAIVLDQTGPWTYGVIGSHLWSFAGDDSRRNINLTTLSPFVGYTTQSAFTFLLEVDALYNWDADDAGQAWTIPMTFTVSHIRKLGRNLVNLGVSGRYYADAPDNGPEWGARVFVTFMFRR